MVIVFDLDDTLYNEIEFVYSGFREIANYLHNENYYSYMLKEFQTNGSGKVFNNLITHFNLDISLQKLIEIYKFHQPNLSLPSESIELLEFAKQYPTALITDGHYLMQKNKFRMLHLEEYIQYPLFTDYYHTHKPELKAFQMVMDYYKDVAQFIYISDNPKKDFIAPQQLGWASIRYKNPLGIYRDILNTADYEVDNLLACKSIISNIIKKN